MMLPVYTDFEVITLCGSMRFYDTMLSVAHSLTLSGHIVLMPFVNMSNPKQDDMGAEKLMLDKMHLVKIDMSRGIYVVNGDNETAAQTQPWMHTYIGESTVREISYTRHHAKYVRYHIQPLAPENHYDGR